MRTLHNQPVVISSNTTTTYTIACVGTELDASGDYERGVIYDGTHFHNVFRDGTDCNTIWQIRVFESNICVSEDDDVKYAESEEVDALLDAIPYVERLKGTKHHG